ncbi:MAG: topoisomerase DNA-binding C4 zinc finger domain-containing protein, partial [Cetobacterium sp.]
DVPCPCGDGYMILKNGRFGRYLVCQDEEKCKEKISLKGITIPLEDIKNGSIKVKDEVEQQLKIKKGQMTDLVAENNKKLLLKFGRFGSYLESENFTEDNIRISLPSEIRKMLATGSIIEEDGIVHLKKEMDRIKAEEEAILSKAGVCEKCGKPFELKRGRWGKFLACTGYPTCKNIKKIDK